MNKKETTNNAPEGSRMPAGNGKLLYHLGSGVWVKTTEAMADILDKV